MRLKTANFLFFLLLLYLIFMDTSFIVCAVLPLNLTVATDKSVYLQGENIEVTGTLSVGVNPLSGWLVALSVNSPNMTPVLFTTLETDQDGNFVTSFNLPSGTELGTYTILSSVQWANQYALSEVTFEIKSTKVEDVKLETTKALSPFFPVSLTLIATGIAFSLIIFTLIGCGLTFQKKAKPVVQIASIIPVKKAKAPVISVEKVEKIKVPVTPVIPVTSVTPLIPITPVKKMDTICHKTCAKCRRTFLGIRTFCPYCFTFHGRNS